MNDETPWTNQLLIGFDHGGTWVRDFQLRELTSGDTRRIQEMRTAMKKPMTWMARVTALILDTLGDEPIYQAYRATEYQQTPSILKKIPFSDVAYLFHAGHVNTFGSTIEGMALTCRACKSQNVLNVDLNQMDVIRAEPGVETSVLSVQLPRGYLYQGENPNLAGRRFTSLVFRVPTLGDYIQVEQYIGRDQQRDSNSDILRTTLVDIKDDSGTSIGEEGRKALGRGLFDDISALDYNHISRTINELPSVDRSIGFTCKFCGVENVEPLDVSFLYPRG